MAHKTQIEINGEKIEVFEFDHSAQEIDDTVELVKKNGAAVLYTTQQLSVTQKAQARENIGAVSLLEFNAALGDVAAALAGIDEVIG